MLGFCLESSRLCCRELLRQLETFNSSLQFVFWKGTSLWVCSLEHVRRWMGLESNIYGLCGAVCLWDRQGAWFMNTGQMPRFSSGSMPSWADRIA